MDQNLTLTGYGVTLRRLTHDKIEMLRQWRNDPKIQQFMVYREYITPKMQEKWFEKINNDNNLYFIIEYEEKEVGMINIKDIDETTHIGEGGVFIVDEALQNKDVAYRSHLLLFDFAFDELDLIGVSSKIILSNTRAVRFAEYLGSKQIEETVDDVAYFFLSKEDYLSNKNRLHFQKRWNFYNHK